MQLNEIVPKQSEFYLEARKKSYRVRPISLEDEAWLTETFPDQEITNILSQMKMQDVARIAFHQMLPEDQLDFLEQTVEFVTEDGQSSKKVIGGAKLLAACIYGTKEKLAMYQALLETLGISRPAQDMLLGAKDDQKKNPKTEKILAKRRAFKKARKKSRGGKS